MVTVTSTRAKPRIELGREQAKEEAVVSGEGCDKSFEREQMGCVKRINCRVYTYLAAYVITL